MTEKIYKFALVSFGLIAIASFGAGSVADAAVCGNALQGQIIYAGYAGGQATASATNNSPDCTAQVTFSSYKMPVQMSQPGWLDAQVLFDSQTLTLAPGETKTFTVTNPNCKTQLDLYEGPVQPHLSDAAGGFSGQNLLGWNINTYPVCGNNPPPPPPPPPPATLTCAPENQTANVGDVTAFSAQGGNGTYTWTSPGSPATGVGTNFSSAFSTSGQETVTVSSGNQTANCSVTINTPAAPLVCAPENQSINVGDIAVFSATGGNGSYSWTSPGSPATGVGTNFSSEFSTQGTKTVNVTDGTNTAHCSVTVSPLSCTVPNATLNTTLNISQNSATLNAYVDPQGNSTTYYFEYGPTISYGYTTAQQTITTAQNVSATINNLQPNTDYYFRIKVQNTCGSQNPAWSFVTPGNPPPPYYPPAPIRYPVTCGPQTQTVNVGDWASFWAANGGSYFGDGSYSWTSSSDANPSYGSGSGFGTRFQSPGQKIVTVTSSYGSSAQCVVNVNGSQNTYNAGGFNLIKNVLNRTLGQNNFVPNVEAQAGDMVQFEIRVQALNNYNYNYGSNPIYINLRDLLPSGLTYLPGSTTVDGAQVGDGVVNGGINLNAMNSGDTRTVRFVATVNQGLTSGTLTNQAVANSNSNTQNAYATVSIRPRGNVLGAADIVTGPEDAWPISLALGLFASILAYYFYFRPRLALKNWASRIRVIENAPLAEQPKRKTELEKLLEQIKTGEQAPE